MADTDMASAAAFNARWVGVRTASMPTACVDGTQPPIADLWYEGPRRDTKSSLAERDWDVSGVGLVDRAAHEYGRLFHGLPPAFERLPRVKFFTATRTR